MVRDGKVILTDRNGTPLGEDKREIERKSWRRSMAITSCRKSSSV